MIEQAIQDLTAAILEQTKVLRALGSAAAVIEIPPAPEGMAPHMKAERDAIAAAEKEAKAREKAEKAAAKAEKEAAEKAEKEAAEAAAKAAEEAKAAEQAAKDASPYNIADIQKALMKIAAKGKKPEAKAIIQKYGAQSTAGLPASAYADVVADIAALDIDVWTEMFGGNEEEF